MHLQCPHCKGAVLYDPALAQQTTRCPFCNGLFVMPTATVQSSSPAPSSPPPTFVPPSDSFVDTSRAKKPPGRSVNKLVLLGCGIPALLVGSVFVLGIIGASVTPSNRLTDDSLESEAESEPESVESGSTRKMTKTEFKKTLRSIMAQGQLNDRFISGLWNQEKFMNAFGEPQSDASDANGGRYWTFACKDGMVQLHVHYSGQNIVIQGIDTY